MKSDFNKFKNEPTITESRNEYRVPFSEVSIWKENGWHFNEIGMQMEKGNKIVKIKIN